MNGPTLAQVPDTSKLTVVADGTAGEASTPSYEMRLMNDLQRLLRYTSTAKDVGIPKDTLEDATNALNDGKTQFAEKQSVTPEVMQRLFKAIDVLSPRVYPVTIASLEIAELMEVGQIGGSPRQIQIRRRVNNLITTWIWATVIALVVVFTISAVGLQPSPSTSFLLSLITFFDPIVLGFLGACTYILRNILQNLANQTFVLRDGTTYTLRSILGMILGFMIPHLISSSNSTGSTAFLTGIAIPFLAGYAVEPMFAALDNVVATIRDAVGRAPLPGTTKAR